MTFKTVAARIVTRMKEEGRGGVCSEGQAHRDAPGCEHAGKPMPPMREKQELHLVLLLGCPVDPRLGCEPESVCITHSPKIHAPASSRSERQPQPRRV